MFSARHAASPIAEYSQSYNCSTAHARDSMTIRVYLFKPIYTVYIYIYIFFDYLTATQDSRIYLYKTCLSLEECLSSKCQYALFWRSINRLRNHRRQGFYFPRCSLPGNYYCTRNFFSFLGSVVAFICKMYESHFLYFFL